MNSMIDAQDSLRDLIQLSPEEVYEANTYYDVARSEVISAQENDLQF